MSKRSLGHIHTTSGFTLLEVLIVIAIIGLIAGIAVMNGRPIVQGQEGAAAIRTMQQSVWQGATMAASRGVRTILVLDGRALEVRNETTNELIRRFELSEQVSLNVENGTLLAFTPPGKVDEATLDDLPNPFRITANDKTYDLQVSLIGEVRVTGGAG